MGALKHGPGWGGLGEVILQYRPESEIHCGVSLGDNFWNGLTRFRMGGPGEVTPLTGRKVEYLSIGDNISGDGPWGYVQNLKVSVESPREASI